MSCIGFYLFFFSCFLYILRQVPIFRCFIEYGKMLFFAVKLQMSSVDDETSFNVRIASGSE